MRRRCANATAEANDAPDDAQDQLAATEAAAQAPSRPPGTLPSHPEVMLRSFAWRLSAATRKSSVVTLVIVTETTGVSEFSSE